MPATTIHEIVPVLQVATGPVILISGIGLLLLTMTNRLGRTIDRARQLCREPADAGAEKRAQTLTQINIIYRRGASIPVRSSRAGLRPAGASAHPHPLFAGAATGGAACGGL